MVYLGILCTLVRSFRKSPACFFVSFLRLHRPDRVLIVNLTLSELI